MKIDMAKKEDLAPGGQAVIEGVMMRSKNNVAIAVRLDNGKIKLKKKKIRNPKFKFMKLPFFRGIFNLIQMLVVGMKALAWSANQQTGEDEELSSKAIAFMIFVSMAVAIIVFVALPYVLTEMIGVRETSRPIMFNIIDGIIKMAFFVAYIWAISLMKDIRRLFEYHGAEHMAVHCYESGKKLTVKNCKKHKTMHERCGTSFIMIVFIISIAIFSVLPAVVSGSVDGFNGLSLWKQKAILFPLRIALIPLIAAIGYELLKLSAKFKDNPIMRLLILPGVLVQKITTKQPDDKQLEVAIKALKAVLR